jgi:hypothetical protein
MPKAASLVSSACDSRLTNACDCCNFCWFHSNPHAIDTPDWHAYKERILAGKPATFQLLDAIWLRYQDHIETQPQQPEEPVPDPRDISGELNDLDDGEVDQLMLATKREFAKAVKADASKEFHETKGKNMLKEKNTLVELAPEQSNP